MGTFLSSLSDGLRWARDHGEDEGAGGARDRVDAAGRPARVVPRRADARVVRHRTLEDPDLLVPDMPVTRDDGALVVAHEHGLVASVRVLPERLPEDARASLHPRDRLGLDEDADGGRGHQLPPLCKASAMASRKASMGWAPTSGLPLIRKVGVPGMPTFLINGKPLIRKVGEPGMPRARPSRT